MLGNELRAWDREFSTLGERRRLKLGRKRWTVLGVLLLAAGLVAAVALYASPKITTTITPSGGLTLAGTFTGPFAVGTPKVNTFTIGNQASSSVTAYLELNITKSGGGAAGDVTVNFGSATIVPVCAGSPIVCTYTSSTTVIAPSGTVLRDVSMQFNIVATFTVALQALGN